MPSNTSFVNELEFIVSTKNNSFVSDCFERPFAWWAKIIIWMNEISVTSSQVWIHRGKIQSGWKQLTKCWRNRFGFGKDTLFTEIKPAKDGLFDGTLRLFIRKISNPNRYSNPNLKPPFFKNITLFGQYWPYKNYYSREQSIWISCKKLDFIKQRPNGVWKGQMYGRNLLKLCRISLVFWHCAIHAHKRRKFCEIEKLSRFYYCAIWSHPITFVK